MSTVGTDQTGVVLGGGPVRAEAYARFLGAEYLAGYLPAGGGSVKVTVISDADVADRFAAELADAALDTGAVYAPVDAATTRVHMIDQVFFAVSAHIDWAGVARGVLATAYDTIGMPTEPGQLEVADVAARYDLDPRELYRSVRRQLEHTLLTDTSLAREMRRAVLRLAQAELGHGDVTAEQATAVLGWLRGDKVPARELKDALIFGRIARHNARAMLASVGRLLLRTGHGGLVVHLDLQRLAEARRPPLDQRSGVYYTKAAVLDAYELLRQLIDATDDLAGTLVVAVIPAELVTDDVRGLPAYSALALRVADEVRDRRRPNPFPPCSAWKSGWRPCEHPHHPAQSRRDRNRRRGGVVSRGALAPSGDRCAADNVMPLLTVPGGCGTSPPTPSPPSISTPPPGSSCCAGCLTPTSTTVSGTP